jgi:hypothetical protein
MLAFGNRRREAPEDEEAFTEDICCLQLQARTGRCFIQIAKLHRSVRLMDRSPRLEGIGGSLYEFAVFFLLCVGTKDNHIL